MRRADVHRMETHILPRHDEEWFDAEPREVIAGRPWWRAATAWLAAPFAAVARWLRR